MGQVPAVTRMFRLKDEAAWRELQARNDRWTKDQRVKANGGAMPAVNARDQNGPRTAAASNPPSTPEAPSDHAGASPLSHDRPVVHSGTSKFRNKKTDGYASKKEAKRALALKLMQEAGQIRGLREQVSFLLIPKALDADGKVIERECRYIADFTFEEWPQWNPVVLDVKGVRTDAYIIKRKLMYMVHGIRVREE